MWYTRNRRIIEYPRGSGNPPNVDRPKIPLRPTPTLWQTSPLTGSSGERVITERSGLLRGGSGHRVVRHLQYTKHGFATLLYYCDPSNAPKLHASIPFFDLRATRRRGRDRKSSRNTPQQKRTPTGVPTNPYSPLLPSSSLNRKKNKKKVPVIGKPKSRLTDESPSRTRSCERPSGSDSDLPTTEGLQLSPRRRRNSFSSRSHFGTLLLTLHLVSDLYICSCRNSTPLPVLPPEPLSLPYSGDSPTESPRSLPDSLDPRQRIDG